MPETRFLAKRVSFSAKTSRPTHNSTQVSVRLLLSMASFEDYDEFGNYIGADIDSDEEGDVADGTEIPHAQQQQPLEGYDDEPMGGDPGTALMEVDGESHMQLMRPALNTAL